MAKEQENVEASLDRKIIIFHNGEEYLCINKDNGVILKGENLKDSDGNLITDSKPLLKAFCIDLFTQYFENITILSAAGTSMDNGANKGKDRKELWEECETKLTEISGKIKNVKEQEFWRNKNLEDALSYIETYQKLKIGDVTAELNDIKNIIRKNCSLKLDEAQAPHEEFLRKVTARKINSSRVQLFTTNYDTLWEQAASKAGFIVIDGFSFSHPRKF